MHTLDHQKNVVFHANEFEIFLQQLSRIEINVEEWLVLDQS